jgi:DNA-binding SARP family transcriptional activator
MKHRRDIQEHTREPEHCLRIYTLGPAWAEWKHQPLAICRRQARALLFRLAAQMQPVPREEICFAFWPDVPEAAAHRHLSHLLSHLRETLPLPTAVVSNNDLVELDGQQVWCDAAEFRIICSSPETSQAAALQKAVSLYRGPFLSGFSVPDGPEFEAWAIQQRSMLEHLYLDALQTLVRAAANQADWERAILYAREYLRVDDLAEEVHRRLMVLHVMMGNRPAALQQYRECAAVLQKELGVGPLPATRAVYQAIMQNEI